jgi:hypothetical protein
MAVAICTKNKIPTVVAVLLLELMTSSPLPEGNAYGTRGMTPDRAIADRRVQAQGECHAAKAETLGDHHVVCCY